MRSFFKSLSARGATEPPPTDLLTKRNDFPFGRTPWGTADTYREIFETTRAVHYPEIAAVENELGYILDCAWLDELALHSQVVIKESRINYQHDRLLYAALRQYLESAPEEDWVNILETGTARGFSAICMARALADAGRSGVILSLDVLPRHTTMYWNCVDDREEPKTRHQPLSAWHEYEDRVLFLRGDTIDLLGRLSQNRVRFDFLNAQHSYEAVMQEASFVLPRQWSGEVTFFDDVTPQLFPGVVSAVEQLET